MSMSQNRGRYEQERPLVDARDNDRRARSHDRSSSTAQSSRNSMLGVGLVSRAWDSLRGSEEAKSPSRTRAERPDNIENDRSHCEDLPPRQEDVRPVNKGHTQDVLSQKMELAQRIISQKEADIKQIKMEAEELSRNHEAHICHLEQKLEHYHAYASKKEAEYAQQLHNRDENIKQLNVSLAKLRKEHQELGSLVVGAQESALESMVKKSGWSPKEDPLVREEFAKMEMKLRTWVKNYGAQVLEDLENIPGTEKDKIIKQLDGYCIQADWRTLMTKMSIPRNKIPAVLLHSLLARDIFEWVFADPFFAFAEMEGDPALPKPKEWNNLYRTMREVHEAEAHIWRSETLRILSTATNPNTESQLARLIRPLVGHRTVSFLTSPASLLLRQASNPGNQDRCTQDLQRLYHEAAELALSLWTQRTFMRPYSQRDLPKFHISNPKMLAHRLHHLDEDDTRLDGKDVLLFVQPAIVAFGNEDAENYDRAKIWAYATAVVDEIS